MCTPAQLNRAQKDAREIVEVFRDRLKNVGNNGLYTLSSLQKVCGNKHAAEMFIKQCEVAPHVKVHRTYGRKGLCQFQFACSESMAHKDRVREIAQRIIDRPESDTQSRLDAEEIVLLTEA